MSKNITAHDLNITVANGDEGGLFRWLLASFLMGKRIQAPIAVDAYRVIVEKNKCDTPRKLANRSHQELVAMLGEANYVRYDESTADRLHALASKLNTEYGGKISHLREASADRHEFEQRLQAFEGIGPKTVEIFMREAGKALF